MLEAFIQGMNALPSHISTGIPLAGVLLRHAEKEIVSSQFGNEANITERGQKDCRRLKKALDNKKIMIYSSPLKRCIQTAELLSPVSKTISTNELLGNPGFLITDTIQAEPYFLKNTPLQIAMHLLNNSPNPPGFCHSTPTAIRVFMNHILEEIYREPTQPEISLFITHDIMLSVILGYFFPLSTLEYLWPDYLEGLFFCKDNDKLHLYYRGHGRSISW